MGPLEIGVLVGAYLSVVMFVSLHLTDNPCTPSEKRVKVLFWPLFAFYYIPKWALWVVKDILKGFADIILKRS